MMRMKTKKKRKSISSRITKIKSKSEESARSKNRIKKIKNANPLMIAKR